MIDDKWLEDWLEHRLGPDHTFNIQILKDLVRDIEPLIRTDERAKVFDKIEKLTKLGDKCDWVKIRLDAWAMIKEGRL